MNSADGLEALREEWRSLNPYRNPDGRWKVKRLRQEIAASRQRLIQIRRENLLIKESPQLNRSARKLVERGKG